MMNGGSGRRMQPRVEFRKNVRVIWPGEVSGVVARAVNLSPAGILVDAPAPTPCPVGSDVLCDVALPGGSQLLRGRVAHRRELPSAKVGMGIEFVDLSPGVAAELHDVVEESEPQPQRVKVRFAGTQQIVSARALPTADGFQLATALPFLRVGVEVDVLLSPDAEVNTKGRVAAVALDRSQGDGTPRLLIDVRVGEPTLPLPVMAASLFESVPAAEAASAPSAEAAPPAEAASAPTVEEAFAPTVEVVADVEPLPVADAACREPSPASSEDSGRILALEDPERTQIVRAPSPRPPRRLRGPGLLAGAVAFAAAVLVLVGGRLPPFGVSPPLPRSAPSSVPPNQLAPLAAAPGSPSVVEMEPTTASAVVPDEPSVQPLAFTVGLVGSLAGAVRYPLREPDGVAFNLPHARATMKAGTYTPAIAGLRAVWVRDIPGGGTHLRFFYGGAGPAPEIELRPGAVLVTAR